MERSKFVNFCSAHSRLPAALGDFVMKFKLLEPPINSNSFPDNYYPKAFTCFFSLSLPKYSSTQVCILSNFLYTMYYYLLLSGVLREIALCCK